MPSLPAAPLVALHGWPPESLGDIGLCRLVSALRHRGVEVVSIHGPHDTLPTTLAAWVDDFETKLSHLEAELLRPPALLGYCMSAIVALELATRRPEVPYVGLVDMWLPHRRLARGDYRRYEIPWRMLPKDLLEQRRKTPSHTWRAVAAENFREYKYYRHGRRHDPELGAWRTTPAGHAIFSSALRAEPRACRVHVHLYPTEVSVKTRSPDDLSLGWSSYLQGGYRTTLIAGNHLSCFDGENLEQLCSAIVRDLER